MAKKRFLRSAKNCVFYENNCSYIKNASIARNGFGQNIGKIDCKLFANL